MLNLGYQLLMILVTSCTFSSFFFVTYLLAYKCFKDLFSPEKKMLKTFFTFFWRTLALVFGPRFRAFLSLALASDFFCAWP